MGLTYKGGAKHHHSLKENLQNHESNSLFQRHGNHYGEINGKSAKVTTIKSNDPIKTAQEFFDKIGYGGKFMINSSTGRLDQNLVYMYDGTIIYYRVTSKSGSPAISINVSNSRDNCGLRTHKIHFIK